MVQTPSTLPGAIALNCLNTGASAKSQPQNDTDKSGNTEIMFLKSHAAGGSLTPER